MGATRQSRERREKHCSQSKEKRVRVKRQQQRTMGRQADRQIDGQRDNHSGDVGVYKNAGEWEQDWSRRWGEGGVRVCVDVV